MNNLAKQLQIERDTSFLYNSIAKIQTDESMMRVLKSLSEIEKRHTEGILATIQILLTDVSAFLVYRICPYKTSKLNFDIFGISKSAKPHFHFAQVRNASHYFTTTHFLTAINSPASPLTDSR